MVDAHTHTWKRYKRDEVSWVAHVAWVAFCFANAALLACHSFACLMDGVYGMVWHSFIFCCILHGFGSRDDTPLGCVDRRLVWFNQVESEEIVTGEEAQ